MKIARFDDWATGLVVSDTHLIDVAASIDGLASYDAAAAATLQPLVCGEARLDWANMIEAWAVARRAMRQIETLGQTGAAGIILRKLADVTLQPPLISSGGMILAAGANFADHASNAKTIILGKKVTEEELRAERDQGLPPWGYTVLPRTVVGPDAELVTPQGATMLDYEVEVAIVLARGGRNIVASDLAVWGFTAWNDVSIRDHFFGRGPAIDRGIMTWCIAKNFDTANPCGPWIVVDEPFDLDNLPMATRVNGEVRQNSTTAGMIYTFGDIVEHLSSYFTLRPGDILLSGTPAGCMIERGPDAQFLRPGDTVEVEVGGIVLRNRVKA
jgi:2-keto-4-pentenoate hydratase/2-oxohepta-3-ene-1,7-dioic acid hydratase in catechol pathway